MLKIEKLEVRSQALTVLWDISLKVAQGEIVALIGSNGAGKTTLLKAVTGLVKCSRGSICYQSLRLDQLLPHQIVAAGVAMVPEGRRVFPEMSVLENLELGAFCPQARKVRQETLAGVYDIFPLLKVRSRQRAGTLSGGEQQMLSIARALMSTPKLLLIDEMSQGLAPIIVNELTRLIKHINQTRQISILLVEQNVALALNLAHRGYIIENGRIGAEGLSQDLLNSPLVREAYLGQRTGLEEE